MKICSIEGCNGKIKAKGYCNKHYRRVRKYGTHLLVTNKKSVPTVCTYPGCNKKHVALGYCSAHYSRLYNKGTLELERELGHIGCKVSGCTGEHAAKGYCDKHYKQIRRQGYIYTKLPWFYNNYHVYDGLCYIECRSIDGKSIRTVGIIDAEDMEIALKYKWHAGSKKYLTTAIKGKGVRLHKILTGYELTDHINGDPTDNRRCNLRECTRIQNSWNTKCVGAIPYKGVSFNKSLGKYITKIVYLKKCIYGGSYKTPEEAALRYNELAKQYHGEFARLNEVPEQCQ